MLKKYDLYEFKDYYPSELSGGMRQRVALIRTLILNPDLLLLDEPFSSLDYQTKIKVQEDMYKIIKEEKKTAILVTHDISEAISMADRIIVLTKRPTSIKNVYSIDLGIENGIGTEEQEKEVTKIEESMINDYIEQRRTFVINNTNLKLKYRQN